MNDKKQPLEEADWAWSIPEQSNLDISGTLLIDMLNKAGMDFGFQFKAKRCPTFEVSVQGPDKAGQGNTGNWKVVLAPKNPPPSVDCDKYNPQRIPRILIETPQDVPIDPEKPGEYKPVADEFSAAEFASIVALAMNLYLSLANEWKKERIETNMKPEPFLTSWQYLQKKIIPALRKQFMTDAEKLLQKAKEDRSEAEKLRKTQELMTQEAEKEREAIRSEKEQIASQKPFVPVYDRETVAVLLNALANVARTAAHQVRYNF